jgi:hypothetical protein
MALLLGTQGLPRFPFVTLLGTVSCEILRHHPSLFEQPPRETPSHRVPLRIAIYFVSWSRARISLCKIPGKYRIHPQALLNNHCFPDGNIMGRPKGAKNRRTILKEAEQHVGSKYVDQVLDSLYVIEMGMRHFFIRAEMGKNAGRKKEEVDEDYKQAAALAALVAPFRHARLSAMKLAGDPNSPTRFKDDATADELRAELMKRIVTLHDAGLIDLQALPAPKRKMANYRE